MKQMFLSTLALLLIASPAAAHVPPGQYGSFAAGMTHPLFGLDHILAMVSVGLWASVLGGRALWAVPTAFVSFMVVGFLLAVTGVPLPFVEPMILASTVALGLLVTTTLKMDVVAGAAIVGLFALFHGHAHGAEMGTANALHFGPGFVLATAMLHAAGVGIGAMVGRLTARYGASGNLVMRGLGALTTLTGLSLVFG
ncbi:MAG: HupE/UreJ family protein [Maritimibacter sp.]